MASSIPKEGLIQMRNAVTTELQQEGFIDNYFMLSEQLKTVNGPYYFANLLLTFIGDAQNAILGMASLLEQEPVNFHSLDQLAIKLRGSTSCIGVCAVARACLNLRQATKIQDRASCLVSLNEIRYEFGRVHARLDAIIQLERDIACL